MENKENTQKLCRLDLSTPLKVKYTRTQADREIGYQNETVESLLRWMCYGNDNVEDIGGIMIDVSKLREMEKLNEQQTQQDAGRTM